MKTRCSFSSLEYSVVAVVLFVASGVNILRAGGMAGGAIGIGAASASGGGHASVSSAGSAHASAPAMSRGAFASRAGAGSLRPITATYSGPPHYLPGGFTPGTSSRSSFIGIANNRLAAAPFVARSNPSVTSTVAAAQVRNAWTDPASASAGQRRGVDNYNGGGQRAGTILYPDATHDAFGNRYPSAQGYAGSSNNSSHRFNFNRRGYYDPYDYGYPGVFVGGYSPYLYGDGLGSADLSGEFTGGAPNTVSDSDALSPAVQSDLARPYPSVQYPLTSDSSDSAAAPQAPANPGAQSKGNGPDSLVEAVQAELSRRGYFGGPVDSIYNDATHAAIQRFQQDQKLPASGRINEATLHALELD